MRADQVRWMGEDWASKGTGQWHFRLYCLRDAWRGVSYGIFEEAFDRVGEYLLRGMAWHGVAWRGVLLYDMAEQSRAWHSVGARLLDGSGEVGGSAVCRCCQLDVGRWTQETCITRYLDTELGDIVTGREMLNLLVYT